MSLFVGNVSKLVEPRVIEKAFKQFGECEIDFRKRYAFVQYHSEHCAEQAMRALQHKNYGGLYLKIEWSKKSGKFEESRRRLVEDNSWDPPSPSWERRRRSPRYEPDSDFHPVCPRDIALKKMLREKERARRERTREKERRSRDRSSREEGEQRARDSPELGEARE